MTLVELLIVILVSSILGAAVLTAVSSTSRAERVAQDLRVNTDSARFAMERLRDELRTAWGVCDVSDDQSVTVWWRDEDGNGRIDPDELRTYRMDGSDLIREVPGRDDQILAFGLGAASGFSYLDRAGVDPGADLDGVALDCSTTEMIEDRGDIAVVSVVLEGDQAPEGRTNPTRVETRIAMRNAAVADGTINPNRPPVASFTQTCTGLTCTFDAGGSYDEDGEIASYLWTFGATGLTGTGEVVTTTFPAPATYNVVLQVVDDGGASDSQTQFVDLTDSDIPSAQFSVSCSDLTCTFDPSATTYSGGTIGDYIWDVGESGVAEQVVSSSAPLVHTYDAPGTYTVSLRVTDASDPERYGTEVRTANPTTDATGVTVEIADISSWHNNNFWFPRVQMTVRYADGTVANGVRVEGRFGPDANNFGSLRSAETNAQGVVSSLQANNHTGAMTYLFRVDAVRMSGGATIPINGPTPVVTLNRPS